MIVVTGAAGFIASHVAAQLCRDGVEVVAVDQFAAPGDPAREARALRYLRALPLKARVEKDALPSWLDEHGAAVRGIAHLGACSDTTQTDRDFMMSNNFEYTRTLWRWATGARVPFVYASSAATYGDGTQGFDDAVAPERYAPLNLYGESKHRFDLWALAQTDTPPRWAGLKYFNVYGPHEDHKGRMASMVMHSFYQVTRGDGDGKVRLFESHRDGIPHGGQKRDFVYVEDAAAATLYLLRALDRPGLDNGLYNIGTGQARSFEDLARAVFAALGRPPAIEYIPMPEDLRAQYQYFTEAKVSKLRAAGYETPFLSLEEGVKRYVKALQGQSPEDARA